MPLLCVPVMGVTVNVCLEWNHNNKSQADVCFSCVVGSELAAVLNFLLAQPLPKVIYSVNSLAIRM